MDADPNSPNRAVELTGTPEQISKAEQLIKEVLDEAESGGSGTVSKRFNGQLGDDQTIHESSKQQGGETIKTVQTKSGARIQLIRLHTPPGDTSTERTVYIDGTQHHRLKLPLNWSIKLQVRIEATLANLVGETTSDAQNNGNSVLYSLLVRLETLEKRNEELVAQVEAMADNFKKLAENASVELDQEDEGTKAEEGSSDGNSSEWWNHCTKWTLLMDSLKSKYLWMLFSRKMRC
ncbi:Far upstream element-binding protein like [Thalictrum thalictroides]|uniref:Far upstream element-binding protein like n=1 Tax=Thalictrum thalictroides TaxID=46969 RepID=A0A7J6VGE7_THATH|nr:Far upstream element-binding protein like [Thalictrum thalictroides]